MGIDFYFDGCRLLPDSVTVVKATVEVIDIDLNTLKPAESDLPEMDSPCRDPTYKMKVEIRPPNLIPTAIALITLSTIEETSNESKIVGYSMINLFLNRASKAPSTSNADKVN